MEKTPKSLRLQIGLFGRTNVGKSSFLNMVAGQDVAITSSVPGTTTDVVEKVMEFLPIGPVVFLDTGGMDDSSVLAEQRIKRTRKVFDRADVVVLITEPGEWTGFEDAICDEAMVKKAPLIVVVNKTDLGVPSSAFLEQVRSRTERIVLCSSVDATRREEQIHVLKRNLLEVCPDDFLKPPPLIADLVPAGGLVVLVVPIDLEAPKGRLILPQVQTIREVLDSDAAVLVVKEREYASLLARLKSPPDIVVCDSQVVLKMVADTPPAVRCTTFSILFSRLKGDLAEMARGVTAIDTLKTGDKVLIAESCSHHAVEDDIGRVKIPRWLKQYAGVELDIRSSAGRDYPDDLETYSLIIHCGSCMLTRREMLFRIEKAKAKNVPITNYGVAISFVQGVLERTLAPFPAALAAYRDSKIKTKGIMP
ncbi:MAG: [FeFe] hydrogenase H-cluster maturation GTPase HydF [Candidatus Omnitrophica bacterium]|nr:[FeFe] hydrogenase H-cluster maturation GTPase HydF [Candidatus Omnitrophota bacterium]